MSLIKKITLAIVVTLTFSSCINRTNPDQVTSKKAKTAESAGVYVSEDYTSKDQLDKKQIAPRVFQEVLSMNNFGFDIRSAGEGSMQQLKILPYGLTIDNKIITEEIIGNVSDAVIDDLNSDGFPEILIYTTAAGSGSYGNVIGYSVNNGKSMSRISFPNIAENPEAGKGYMGHDQFRIVENTLVQKFHIFN